MLTIKAMTGGETYARNHLSNNDYYAQGETVTGRWMGNGAKKLGLEGDVTMQQFDAIRQGNDPATGEFLRQRKSANRHGKEGEVIQTARNLYDFTISAPKAISVQALEDPRLINAHETAVAEAAAEMESFAGARIRKGHANDTRITSNLVIARYDHDASRELDPQLHSHLVAGNLTYDATEGKWKALQASGIYERREYISEVYRNALAREVTALGYAIEDRFEDGKDRGFGISGIAESTLEKYSRRSAQRDQAISEFLEANGRLPSNREVAQLVRDSRKEKLHAITTAEVKARQLARMEPEEAAALRHLRQSAVDRGNLRQQLPAEPSFQYAADHIYERVSVSRDYDLYTTALRHARGKIELPELKAVLKENIASGAMLEHAGEVATKETLARERWMVNAINSGIAKHDRLGRRGQFLPSDRLRPEQKAAVLAVLDTRDLAINMRGAAGTGKTATLQELKRGLTEERRNITALAPTASAVEELKKVGFTQAITISRFLADSREHDGLAGSVIIVDEAGMVASKAMAQLIDLAQTKRARLVFSGDTAQIKSVNEGDALRVLERESKLASVSLLQVQRQTNPQYRAAVETLRNRPLEGFRKFEQMGAIQEVDWKLRGFEAAAAYRQLSATPNVQGKPRTVLVVAATHDEIKSVTYAIRKDRKRLGEIADGETFIQHRPLDWTEAQKRDTRNYRAGQVLEFHKPIKGIKKNEAVEVLSADAAGIKAKRADGSHVTITPRAGRRWQTDAYGVFERETVEVSTGDKLLLQANRREKGFIATNGELVTVSAVTPAAITLEDGRIMPARYKQFSHGYAVTAHRSQGKTVDAEVIVAERMRHDLFYVAATRARESLTVITSDSLTLQESIVLSGDRQSATELSKRAAEHKGLHQFDRDNGYRIWQRMQAPSRGQPEIRPEVNIQHDRSPADFGRSM